MVKQDDGILSLLLSVDVDEDAFKDAEQRLKDLLAKEQQFASGLGVGGKIGAGVGAVIDAGAITVEILGALKKASQAVVDRAAEAAPRWAYTMFGITPSLNDALNSIDHNKELKAMGVTSGLTQQWASDVFAERANIIDLGHQNDERVIRQSEIAQRRGIAADHAEYYEIFRHATPDQYMKFALDALQWAVETGDYNNVETARAAYSIPKEIVNFALRMEQGNKQLRENGETGVSLSAYLMSSRLDNAPPEMRKFMDIKQLERAMQAKENAQTEYASTLNKDASASAVADWGYAINTSIKTIEETATRIERDLLMFVTGNSLPKYSPYYLDGEKGFYAIQRLAELPDIIKANGVRAGLGWTYAKKTGQYVPVVDEYAIDDFENYQDELQGALGKQNVLDADIYQGDRMDVSNTVLELGARIAKVLGIKTDTKYASHKERQAIADFVTDITTRGGNIEGLRYSGENTGAPSAEALYSSTLEWLLGKGDVKKARSVARMWARDEVKALLRRKDNPLGVREGTTFEDLNVHETLNAANGHIDVKISYVEDDTQATVASFSNRSGLGLELGSGTDK